MRKRLVFFVLIVVIFAAKVQAETRAPVNKETVRQAIAIFRRNPVGPQAESARSIIVQFTSESREVHIVAGPKEMPWIGNSKVPIKIEATLLAAYFAGDVLSQLDKGKVEDDPLAATTQVIATYRQLQKTTPALKIPELEHLSDLQQKGKLADHLKDL